MTVLSNSQYSTTSIWLSSPFHILNHSGVAVQVANMAILIDPARIAVGGGLMSRPDVVLQAIERRLRLGAPFAPELVPAQFIHDGPLRGAIALALDEAGG